MKLAEILASTAEPAFASDGEGRIVGWNRAAEEVTGNVAHEVIGRPCHEVLCGRDVFGNRYCEKSCLIANMARLREPIRPFQLEVQMATGERLRVEISILVLPESEDSELAMIHIFSPVEQIRTRTAQETALPVVAGADPRSSATSAPRGEHSSSLTPREIEVLRLLAEGNTSQDIAIRLYISLPTVRTHIQNILRKLELHSQVEAVAYAFRKGLI